ncbi:MAG: glycoside hydrolase family 31 protein [Acidobacteria bacterium]|nr:glycoside hydrolase family 31 protein [Acidobacteriota bacterium]
MKKSIYFLLFALSFVLTANAQIVLPSKNVASGKLKIDGLFYETAQGRVFLPAELIGLPMKNGRIKGEWEMRDGRTVRLSVVADKQDYILALTAEGSGDIKKWGLAIDALPGEYYTGLMERVVDGPQQESWKPGITAAMNLSGQRVEMIVKPTTSVYAPFYLSSRGYAVFTKGDWPGVYDFAAEDKSKVRIEFEGPRFELKIYTAKDPAALVKAHALDAGAPILPPRWTFAPWRWRDEHTERATYYDGTPVAAPFNSEVVEDVLMMKAFGIPNGVYWIDRPWGPGRMGYDDFEIDEKRLPNFDAMVKWLGANDQKMVLWIAPFLQGKMADEGTAKGYTLKGQVRPPNGNNFPMVDLSNPDARAYWQAGIEKLLKRGVAGFKLDRGEENIPDDGQPNIFDGRSLRENRNAYMKMYVEAVYDIAKKYRGDDFVAMPRGAYTGTAKYSVNWGGDIGGSQEGLRASIIAVQRSAVMGYSTWGSDTCGYTQQLTETETCGRWLAFSAFTPIMEVGPTRNLGFWNLPREPKYDATLIALWRLYARIHQKLIDYSYAQAREANRTGLPVVRPLLMVDPQSKAAWENWWTYLYGSDILVSPVWEKNRREQTVYLPKGEKWRDAWTGKIYSGGQTITVKAELHQLPIFIRAGSKISLGDLDREWRDAQAIAQKRPDLKTLEAEVSGWFEKNK